MNLKLATGIPHVQPAFDYAAFDSAQATAAATTMPGHFSRRCRCLSGVEGRAGMGEAVMASFIIRGDTLP